MSLTGAPQVPGHRHETIGRRQLDGRQLDLSEQAFHQPVEEGGLVAHVAVEGHRRHPEPRGDGVHGHRGEPGLVGQGQRGIEHDGTVEEGSSSHSN